MHTGGKDEALTTIWFLIMGKHLEILQTMQLFEQSCYDVELLDT